MTSCLPALAPRRGACVQISSGVAPGDVEDRDVDLLAEDLELLDGGGALHVGGDEQRLLALLLEQARELRAGRRLARALEADHHDAGRLALGRQRRWAGPSPGDMNATSSSWQILTN